MDRQLTHKFEQVGQLLCLSARKTALTLSRRNAAFCMMGESE